MECNRSLKVASQSVAHHSNMVAARVHEKMPDHVCWTETHVGQTGGAHDDNIGDE